MDCSCRTAALRTFVRSIAQVYPPLRAAAPLGARYHAHINALASQPSQFRSQRNPSVAAIAPRGFHTSCARNSAAEAAEAAVAAGEETGRTTTHLDDSAVAETRSTGSERSAGRSPETETQAPRTGATSPRLDRTKKKDKTGQHKPRPRFDEKRPRAAGQGAGAEQVETEAADGDKTANKDWKGKKDWKANKDGTGKKDWKANKDGTGKTDWKANKDGKDWKNKKTAGPPPEPKPKEMWMIQKEALKKKFPEGWKPRKKLSPDAMAGIRMLHDQFPDEYTTEALAAKFEVSAEAIRRILKSRWKASAEEEADRQERWFKRGKSVWTQWAALGKKPPRRWRAEGIVRDPVWNKPRGPTHKKKDERAEAQRRLAWAMKGMEPPPRPAKPATPEPAADA